MIEIRTSRTGECKELRTIIPARFQSFNKMALTQTIRPSLMITFLLLVIFIGVTRIPLVLLNNGYLLFIDEYTLTLSCLDRFLGVPAVNLAWPGGPTQMLGVLFVVAEFMVNNAAHLSQSGWLEFVSILYRDPWHLMTLLRIVSVIFSTIGFAALIYPLYIETKRWWLAVMGVLLFVLNTHIWLYSAMATGDGISLGLICLALACSYYTKVDYRFVPLAGFLIGLAAASKITVVLAAPFLVAVICENSKHLIYDIVVVLIFTLIGFLFACPYMWTSPLVFAKSVLGTLGRFPPLGFLAMIKMWLDICSPVLVIVGIFGLIPIVFRRRYLTAISAIIVFTVTLVSIARDGVAYARYFLPAMIPLIVMFCTAVESVIMFSERLLRTWHRNLIRSLLILIVIMTASYDIITMYMTTSHFQTSKNNVSKFMDILNIHDNLGQKYCFVPFSLFPYVSNSLSKASVLRIWNETNITLINGIKRREFLFQKGLTKDFVQAFEKNFNAPELALGARLRIMAFTAPECGLNVRFYGDTDVMDDLLGLTAFEEALRIFQNGEASCFFTTAKSGQFGLEIKQLMGQ